MCFAIGDASTALISLALMLVTGVYIRFVSNSELFLSHLLLSDSTQHSALEIFSNRDFKILLTFLKKNCAVELWVLQPLLAYCTSPG
jgi:hypothetical protein